MSHERILLIDIQPLTGGFYYFSTAAYTSLPTDVLANNLWLPRISNDPTFSKKARMKIWGGGRSVSSIGYIDLINQDGALDYMVNGGLMEGAFIEMSILFDTRSWDNRVVVVTGAVDTAEAVGEDFIRLTLRDQSKNFERALADQEYSSALSVSANRAAQKPVTIGSPLQCPPTLVSTSSLLSDTHDSAFFKTNAYAVYSRGVLATENTDWRIARTTSCNGFEYLVSMAAGDPFTANPGGQLDIDTVLIDSTPGDNPPTGFTVNSYTGSSSKFVGWVADTTFGGANGYSTTAGRTCDMYVASLSIPANSLVRISFKVTHVYTAGTLRVSLKNGTTYVHNKDVAIAANGDIHFTIQVGGTSCNTISFVVGATTAVIVSIDDIRAYIVLDTTVPINAARHLAVTRGGLSSNLFDDTSWGLLDINGGTYVDAVGMYCNGNEMVADKLDELADSYTAFWWISYDGYLKVRQLEDPALSMATVYDLSASQVASASDIQVEPDRAPGLSNKWGYDRNILPLDDNDLAGSVTAANRALYKAEYRVVVASSAVPHTFYDFAVGAPPIPTVLYGMDSTNGAVEPNRVVGYYTIVRYFTTVPYVVSDASILALDLGQLVRTDLTRFGMDSSVKLLVGIEGSFLSPTVRLTMWS